MEGSEKLVGAEKLAETLAEDAMQGKTCRLRDEADIIEGEPENRWTWEVLRGLMKIGRSTVRSDIEGGVTNISPASAAWFLGPKAENEDILKDLVKIAIDQHVDFRKYKYFPLDPVYVTPALKEEEAYIDAIQTLKDELYNLTRRLSNSVPFFNFRSQGHMLWDTTLPSTVGYIAALLYNQNNVASMASGVTLQLEREVSMDLCSMVGYNVLEEGEEHSTQRPNSWGHLPNGGTVANLEAMWAARCLKFNGLALHRMIVEKFEELGLKKIRNSFSFRNLNGDLVKIKDATVWELLNIPLDEAIDLFDKLARAIRSSSLRQKLFVTEDKLFSLISEYSLEELGGFTFFDSLKDKYQEVGATPGGVWMVPGSRHYGWDKGANILGFGRTNLIKIPVDRYCRISIEELEKQLQKCLNEKKPVIGVTAVFGTTQEGAVDELDKILELREKFEKKGMTFYIHIDGAWGGYFASVLRRDPDELNFQPEPLKSAVNVIGCQQDGDSGACIFNEAQLSQHFQRQLNCLPHANSITLDPHKSGFCPYPAGGLLYRNGNIRKFLAQKAAYVSHGSGKNEEINLFGVDGSKPGAASAGVWLSHKVIGLHENGYGLLLQQCSFSAGVMYATWCSMEYPQDPFTIVPTVPRTKKNEWTKARIRREILEAENHTFRTNSPALEFISENGPDTLINSVVINFRSWNREKSCWELNRNIKQQEKFVKKFYQRCSHSFEKPSMVDRGIQIILNTTSWTKEGHGKAYTEMKECVGLDMKDNRKISVIINTCMSPWLRSQKTFKRIGTIIRNEMYNAYGAIHDDSQQLHLVSPCSVFNEEWSGEIVAELEASFSKQNLNYHAIASFLFNGEDIQNICKAARKAREQEKISKKPLPLKIVTKHMMTVFELMTRVEEEKINIVIPDEAQTRETREERDREDVPLKEKLRKYKEDISYDDIPVKEIEVIVYFGDNQFDAIEKVSARMKLKRVLRFQHLSRDFVDELDYPSSQEYMLYVCDNKAYMSHCPNRWPDFQQLIALDQVPKPGPYKGDEDFGALYEEALERGVVVYLPQVVTGGKPVMSKKEGKKEFVCRDPLKDHVYNAVSWGDQGAFTGDMTSILVKFYNDGKRWFNGERINANYDKQNFPHLYDEDGQLRKFPDEEDYCDSDEED